MSDFSTITWLILIVVGILQIILFFKVWNMTKNISLIATKFIGEYKYLDYINLAKEELYFGNQDKAKEYFQRAKVRAEQELPSYPEHIIKDALAEIDELLKFK